MLDAVNMCSSIGKLYIVEILLKISWSFFFYLYVYTNVITECIISFEIKKSIAENYFSIVFYYCYKFEGTYKLFIKNYLIMKL